MAGSSEPAFLFSGIKTERCSIDYSSILQRPLFFVGHEKLELPGCFDFSQGGLTFLGAFRTLCMKEKRQNLFWI